MKVTTFRLQTPLLCPFMQADLLRGIEAQALLGLCRVVIAL